MLTKSKSTYSSRMKQRKVEEEKKYEVHLKPKASVNVLSKRPGTALPKAAKGTKGVALRPTTAHPTAKKESALTPDFLLPAPIKEMIARPKSALPKPKPKPKPKVKICKYGYFVTVESVQRELGKQTKKPGETKHKFDVVSTRKQPVNKVVKKEEKKTKLKEKDNKEEQKMDLFSNNSKIAEEDTGAVNPMYLSPAFQRFTETREDQMFFADMLVYSNVIYQNAKASPPPTRLFGPIKKFVTGIIMDFVDYKFMMTKLRYLSKSFLIFTQENCHFSQRMDRKAYIKINLKEAYEGLTAIPMLNHPYYTNCTKLTLIYQLCKIKENSCKKSEYNQMFMRDLFERSKLFPCIKTLKIYMSHSRVYDYDMSKLFEPYLPIVESPHLESLENLIINDSRVIISWKCMLSMTPERFPNLKYLNIPINAAYDFDNSEDITVHQFPNLRVQYSHSAGDSVDFNCKLVNRFYGQYYYDHYETSSITKIGCDKLEFRMPEQDYNYYFNRFNQIY